MNRLFSYPLIVICGHYGSGKTNLALNLACYLSDGGARPSLIDLDIVNPYFRSSDSRLQLDSWGVKFLGPIFGASNLDAPALMPGIEARIAAASLDSPVIIDVGGDPEGARALARFAPSLAAFVPDGQMWGAEPGNATGLEGAAGLILAVVNLRRPQTADPRQNLDMLLAISRAAGLRLNALVGNTHLQQHTNSQTILDSVDDLLAISSASNLPIYCLAVPPALLALVGRALSARGLSQQLPLFAVQRFVRTPWQ
ncbi:MAG: hypothetical protein LBU07_06380 [Coriobacteriales bacterium]|jgi:hypothetical protein|nr:hypothetical protein [Coriobacteriales bacterium]